MSEFVSGYDPNPTVAAGHEPDSLNNNTEQIPEEDIFADIAEAERGFRTFGNEGMDDDQRVYLEHSARNVTERAQKGEVLTQEDWLVLAKDCVAGEHKSELARAFLSRTGFETFNDAADKLAITKGVRIDADGLTATVERKGTSHYLKNVGKALLKSVKSGGIGMGVSYASLAALHIAFPALFAVSGAAIIYGGVGSAGVGFVGRWLAERNRNATLNKEVKNSEGLVTNDTFGEKVAQDLLANIKSIISESKSLVESENLDEAARARIIQNIAIKIANNEVESLKQYKKLEEKTNKTRFWYGFAGSIIGGAAGAYVGSMIQGKFEVARAIAEKGQHGFDANFDGDKISHIVKKGADGAWHYVIKQEDIANTIDKIAHHSSDPGVRLWASNYLNQNLSYLDAAGKVGHDVVQNGVGQLHNEALSTSFIEGLIKQIVMQKIIYSGAVVAASPFVAEPISSVLSRKKPNSDSNKNFLNYIRSVAGPPPTPPPPEATASTQPATPANTPTPASTSGAAAANPARNTENPQTADENNRQTQQQRQAENRADRSNARRGSSKPEGEKTEIDNLQDLVESLKGYLNIKRNRKHELAIKKMTPDDGDPYYLTDYFKYQFKNETCSIQLYLTPEDQDLIEEAYEDNPGNARLWFELLEPEVRSKRGRYILKIKARITTPPTESENKQATETMADLKVGEIYEFKQPDEIEYNDEEIQGQIDIIDSIWHLKPGDAIYEKYKIESISAHYVTLVSGDDGPRLNAAGRDTTKKIIIPKELAKRIFKPEDDDYVDDDETPVT